MGHIARNCPFQPAANVLERDDFPSSAAFPSTAGEIHMFEDGSEGEDAYAAEKRSRDFEVQPKPRKRAPGF
jgi:hypothetical protein